jgi:hypothetical protein
LLPAGKQGGTGKQTCAKLEYKGGDVARDPDTIERDIEQARDALAATLDELSERANPKRFVESGKASARQRLADPRVRYPLIAVGVLILVALLRRLFR